MADKLNATKAVLDKANILPWLRLGTKKDGGAVISTGPHEVKIVSDRLVKKFDRKTNKDVPAIEYVFEENGVQKRYTAKIMGENGSVSYFIQKMGEFNIGDIITLEMRKNGPKNYIDVNGTNGGEVDEIPIINADGEDDIPVVEDDVSNDQFDVKDIPF